MESNFEWRAFERDWTNAIVDSINMVREAEGLTVKKLRARLVQGGWEISEATLSGMLSGRKRGSISVAEVVAFAWALGVPPLFLVLGLPLAEKLPPSPMWSRDATPPRVADWFIGRTRFAAAIDAEDGPPLNGESSDEEVVSRLTSQAMQDVMAHAEQSYIIRWQAAQLVAISMMGDDPMLDQIVHSAVRDQSFLWGAINSLSQARRNQRELDSHWGVELGPLPPVLEFIDRDEEAEDFTIEQLRTLTTDRSIARAKANYEGFAKQVRETMPRESSDGAPTDSTE